MSITAEFYQNPVGFERQPSVYQRGIFVDSDGSGKAMAELCKHSSVFKDKVYTIDSVDSKAKEIENLFSEEDSKKFGPLNPQRNNRDYKRAYYSSLMKNTTKSEDYTEKTRSNFKKLFELMGCNNKNK